MSSSPDNAGLIDPADFPITSTVPNVQGLWDTREVLQKMAARMTARFPVVKQRWQATVASEIYNTPEAGQVRPLMGRAETDANAFSEAAEKAANILGPYTTQLTMAQGRIKAIEAEAAEFRAAVINGVTVTRSIIYEGQLEAMEYEEVVPWYEDSATVEKNAALHEKYNTELAAIQNAAIECSEDIHAIEGVPPFCQPATWTADGLTASETPWGSSEPNAPGKPQDIIFGIGDVAGSWVSGLAGLTGWGDRDAGDTWKNLGKSMGGAAVSFGIWGTALAWPGQDYDDIKAQEPAWAQKLAPHGESFWASLAGGPEANNWEDVKNQWKKNPYRATGMAIANAAGLYFGPKAPVKGVPVRPGTATAIKRALSVFSVFKTGSNYVVAGSFQSIHHGLNALSHVVDGPPKHGFGGTHKGPGKGIFHGSEGTRGPAHRGD